MYQVESTFTVHTSYIACALQSPAFIFECELWMPRLLLYHQYIPCNISGVAQELCWEILSWAGALTTTAPHSGRMKLLMGVVNLLLFFPLCFSPGLGGFLRRVCCLRSSGLPTALLCQQHRSFFWRKWKNSHNVVRPATVRPAYAVPKVKIFMWFPIRWKKDSLFEFCYYLMYYLSN